MKHHAFFRDSAHFLARAAERTLDALRDHRVEHEPAFTDRMLGHIEEAMEGEKISGVRWTAKTLTDRASGAQEKEYGADFMGVLRIDLPDYRIGKGFLAQAKIIEPDESFKPVDYKRLVAQCHRMLDLTPSAFVFLYSTRNITIVPALAVVSSTPCNPHELCSRSIAGFYEEHFESFLGDQRISAPSVDALEALQQKMKSREMLFLSARSIEMPSCE